MSSLLAPPTVTHSPVTPGWTVQDLFDLVGPMPLRRIVMDPAPGTATFDDVLAYKEKHGRYVELIDGVLLEKDMSDKASRIGMKIGTAISNHVDVRNLGIVAGEQGFLRLSAGRVRGPDVSFIAWERLPGGREPETPIPGLAPTLAVEVISPGNTKKEMADSLIDYFRSGVTLVWYVDPEQKQVHVFIDLETATVLGEDDALDGGAVLPGFALPLARLFAEPAGQAAVETPRE